MRHKTLEKLQKLGQKGDIFFVLKDFLDNRKGKTLIGDTKSLRFSQENGLVQGSILVTLFLVAVNELLEKSGNIGKSLFADDLIIYTATDNLKKTTENIQKEIDKLVSVAKEMGWEFSEEKTKSMVFPVGWKGKTVKLEMNGKQIESTMEHKILGMNFDHQLSWKSHINKTIEN